jgi:hypothetical protein
MGRMVFYGVWIFTPGFRADMAGQVEVFLAMMKIIKFGGEEVKEGER